MFKLLTNAKPEDYKAALAEIKEHAAGCRVDYFGGNQPFENVKIGIFEILVEIESPGGMRMRHRWEDIKYLKFINGKLTLF
jgi:hypothetical protein